jgi:hypothetical protein
MVSREYEIHPAWRCADDHSVIGSIFADMAVAGNAEKAQSRNRAQKDAFSAAGNFQGFWKNRKLKE